MYALLSPAKTLDFETKYNDVQTTPPLFGGEAGELAGILSQLSQTALKNLMKLSDSLAKLNFDRYREFALAPQAPAIFAFQGDTYKGLQAQTMDKDALAYAQNHIGILSGLYGLLRPMDAMKPYRLEMGTKLKTPRGKTLYDFWGTRISEMINEIANGQSAVIVLASEEYISAVDRAAINLPMIDVKFLEDKAGTLKVIGIHAKRARGMMARYMVESHAQSPDSLKDFNEAGYSYRDDLSDGETLVFARSAQ